MKISVNGQLHDVSGATLIEVLRELGYGDALVATAVNGDFIPQQKRTTFALKDGDELEIVSPRQGG